MNDTTATEKVAGTLIDSGDLLRLGRRTANGLIKQLEAVAITLDTFRLHEGCGNPAANIFDATFDMHFELHDLPEPYDSSEAVAAFGAAVFGTDAVPDVWDDDRASRVKLAFKIARLILTCDDRGHMDAFFIACAIAAKRKTDKERLKKVKRSAKKRIRDAGASREHGG